MDVVAAAIIGGSATVLAAIFGPILIGKANAAIQRRQHRNESMTPAPPTTLQVWERLDHVEKVQRSFAYVTMRYVNAWPSGEPRPVLAQQHVAVLETEGYDLNPTPDEPAEGGSS